MKTYKLPNTVQIENTVYALKWNVNPNMDGFNAKIKTHLNFKNEEEAEFFGWDHLDFDGVDGKTLYKDGTLILHKKI